MFRNLRAIEIAEGALLADIAVAFQMIAVFLPLGGGFFRLLIFIVFTILVLRRGLYVGCMGLCVTLFLIGVVLGPQFLTLLFIEGLGGLFLGFTMKRRIHHFPLVVVGSIGGAFTLYSLIFFFALLTGLHVSTFVESLHRMYDTGLSLLSLIMTRLGLGVWWQQNGRPLVASLAVWAFTYWWATIYLVLLAALLPFVLVVYTVTNNFVRMLGYDVRPFPGGRFGKLLYRQRRRLIKLGVRWRMLRRRRSVSV